jgi:glycosyltransferase involved in cell wall biosynthesis
LDKLVSILIPNYNKENYIKETLDSVLSQTYTNWECIIVDDHSTDNSWEIIEEYANKDSRFKIYKRPSELNKGGNVCRNYAFKLCSGEYLIYLDSDDILTKWCIAERLNNALKFKEYDIVVYPGMIFKDNPGDSKYIWNTIENKDPIERFLYGDIPWSITGPLFSCSFLKKNDLIWDENLLDWQDADYNLRVLLNGARVLELDCFPDYFVREAAGNNISKNEFKSDFIISRLNMYDKWSHLINTHFNDKNIKIKLKKNLLGNIILHIKSLIDYNIDIHLYNYLRVLKKNSNVIQFIFWIFYLILLKKFRDKRGFHFFIINILEPLIPVFYIKRIRFAKQITADDTLLIGLKKRLLLGEYFID